MSDLTALYQKGLREQADKLANMRQEFRTLVGLSNAHRLDTYTKPENIFKAIIQATANPVLVNNMISRKSQILNLIRDYQALAKQ